MSYHLTREEALEDEEQENYHSASDEDFNPTAEPDVSDSSDNDDAEEMAAKAVKKARQKTKRPAEEDLDSGDEATIQELRRKRQRGDSEALSEDEDGEGGLIKTRAQRAKGYVKVVDMC